MAANKAFSALLSTLCACATVVAAAAAAAPPQVPYYSVQLTTESSRETALNSLRGLDEIPDARVEERSGAYAVRVGALRSRAEAKKLLSQLGSGGHPGGVVLRINKPAPWIMADSAASTKAAPQAAPKAAPVVLASPETTHAPVKAIKADKKIKAAKGGKTDKPKVDENPVVSVVAAAPVGPAPLRELSLTFRDLGAFEPLQLYGVDGSRSLNFGVRRDEVVVKAKLKLRFTYSPALIQELSHIKVLLNNEVLGSLLLPKDVVTTDVTREIDVDPRYFTDYNHLRMQLIGHYTWQCEDAAHSSLWAAINNQSTLELTLRPLNLRADLSLLPAPFFDNRDNRRLDLPFVFGTATPALDVVHAAGVMASWFGAQASYRSARFPTLMNVLPERHGVVFALNGEHPGGLELKDVEAPTISVMPHPTLPAVQLLVIQGRNGEDLNTAAMALVLGQPVLTGQSATVSSVTYAPRRPAYDAPIWARTDRPVKLGELVDTLSQLETYGHVPDAIRVNLRVPPDLWTWNSRGVKVDMSYRYTPPVEVDNSTLTVSINDKYVETLRLPPNAQDAKNKLLVPIFGTDSALSSEELLIPAFQVGADNQLQFRFALDYFRRGACRDTDVSQPHSAVDPESTIDLSSFHHYVAMPNLALFANSGWPFSKFADLGDTMVVLPDAASSDDIEAMLFLLGRMGRQTGTSALRFELARASEVEAAKPDKELLVIGGPAGSDLLSAWGKNLPAIIETDLRSFAPVNPSKALPQEFARKERDSAAVWNVALQSKGNLAAILGFRSPQHQDRSVVAFASSQPGGIASAIDALEDNERVSLIQADLALVHENTVESFRARETYYVGHLPFYLLIWHRVSQHAWLVATLGILAGLVIAFWLFGFLKRVTARRRSA